MPQFIRFHFYNGTEILFYGVEWCRKIMQWQSLPLEDNVYLEM